MAASASTSGDAATGRTTPMKVLCLGLGRTGTISLRESLRTLGYLNVYHTMDAVTKDFYDCKLWGDLLRAKRDGKKIGREDFDKILGNCQAVMDMPAAYFAEELVEAYPDAKVILTVRDVESWYKSVNKTLRPLHNDPLTSIVMVTDQLLLMPTRHVHPMFRLLDEMQYGRDFAANGRRDYERHNARVRALVPAERLLEYHVSDGWEPLCAFLGRAAPGEVLAEGTPHLNSSEAFTGDHRNFNVILLMLQAKRVLDLSAYAALLVTVVGAVARRWPRKFW